MSRDEVLLFHWTGVQQAVVSAVQVCHEPVGTIEVVCSSDIGESNRCVTRRTKKHTVGRPTNRKCNSENLTCTRRVSEASISRSNSGMIFRGLHTCQSLLTQFGCVTLWYHQLSYVKIIFGPARYWTSYKMSLSISLNQAVISAALVCVTHAGAGEVRSTNLRMHIGTRRSSLRH
jgi:hypothetical protein